MAANLSSEHNKRRNVIGAVYEKWTVQVIHALAGGTCRYGELQRELGEVTPKVLTETLRQLEYDGLVQRTAYPVIPPKVEYSLTTLGKTFVDAIDDLCQWAQEHEADVAAARTRFDASHE